MFHPPTGVSVIFFMLVVATVLVAFVWGVGFASAKLGGPAARRSLVAALGLALWLAVLGTVVATGLVAASPLPWLMLLFFASNAMAIAVALSRVGGWLAAAVPVSTLVLFQGFRLPLELVLHDWVRQGSIPETMTWTGSNIDIVAGATALIAAIPARTSRVAAWTANIVGIVLLLNVMRVAIMSSPLPFAWGLSNPLLLGGHLPYALIVPVCVAGALGGHVVLTRALISTH
jgi:hypothetical protein